VANDLAAIVENDRLSVISFQLVVVVFILINCVRRIHIHIGILCRDPTFRIAPTPAAATKDADTTNPSGTTTASTPVLAPP